MATNQKSNTTSGRSSSSTSQGKTGHSNSGNFANMDESKHREISSKGGRSSNSGGNHSTGRH